MICAPYVIKKEEFYHQFIHATPRSFDDNNPFGAAVNEILHLESCSHSFQEKNLLWYALQEEDIFNLCSEKPSTMCFEELMRDRAYELANLSLSLDLPVFITWSGGLDSTAVVLACLPIFKEKNVPYRIISTPLAKGENELLFSQLQDAGDLDIFTYIEFFQHLLKYYEKGIVATGLCGDQLGHSSIARSFGGDEEQVNRTAWQKFIIQRYPGSLCSMSKLVDATGLKIRTLLEFAWIVNNLLKWDFVFYNSICWAALYGGEGFSLDLNRNFPFFGTKNFRLFGIEWYRCNGMPHRKGSRPFTKKYILDRTGDKMYFENKGKEASIIEVPFTAIQHIENGRVIVDKAKRVQLRDL